MDGLRIATSRLKRTVILLILLLGKPRTDVGVGSSKTVSPLFHLVEIPFVPHNSSLRHDALLYLLSQNLVFAATSFLFPTLFNNCIC